MAKKPSTFINMFIALFVICIVAASALAYVNSVTEGPIAQVKQEKQEKAVKAVLPPFETIETKEIILPGESEKLLLIKAFDKDKKIVGTAVKTYTQKGFGGYIGIMVGFLPDENIFSTNVLEHKETPGFGTGMSESPFKDQFPGKNPATFKLMVKKDGGDVDAISSATISSRAFCDALQRAYIALKQEK